MRTALSYIANDGTPHTSPAEAVAHELTITLGAIMPDSTVEQVLAIAQRMTEHPLRSEIVKTLEQLTK